MLSDFENMTNSCVEADFVKVSPWKWNRTKLIPWAKGLYHTVFGIRLKHKNMITGGTHFVEV